MPGAPEGYTPAVAVKAAMGDARPANAAEANPLANTSKVLKEKRESESSVGEKTKRARLASKNEADAVISKAFGSSRDKDGKIHQEPDEKARARQAMTAREKARSFLEKGYDNLIPAEQAELRDILEQAFIQSVGADHPGLDGLKGPDRDVILTRLLKSERFSAMLSHKDADLLSRQFATEIPQLALRDAQLDARLSQLLNDAVSNRALLDKNNNSLIDYGPSGRKTRDLNNLGRELSVHQETLETSTENAASLSRAIERLQKQSENPASYRKTPEKVQEEIEAAEKELRHEMSNIRIARNAIKKHTELVEEKAALEAEQKQLAERENALRAERETVERESAQVKQDLADARDAKLIQEQGLVLDFKNLILDTGEDFVREIVSAGEAAKNEAYSREAASMKDPAEIALLAGAGKRHFTEKRYGLTEKRKRLVPNTNNINEDYHRILNEGEDGLKAIMETMMGDGGLTPDEITAKMADSTFVGEMMPKVVDRILTMRLRTGTITSAESDKILFSSWGEGMMKKAMENNTELKAEEQRLRDEGHLKDATLWEWMKRQGKESKLKLLLLLLGFPVLGAAGVFFGTKNLTSN